jgi:hypothetical protein
MAEAATYPGAQGAYQGIDLVKDLNRGLFAELKQPAPVIELYRRDLQKLYVNMLVAGIRSEDLELRTVTQAGISDLHAMLGQALKRMRDPQTQWHVKSLKGALEKER